MGIKTQIEHEFDYDIIDDFLEHLDVMMEVIEPIILDLRHSENYEADVNELFRMFHNIKSATAYLKLTSMSRLAALTEDVLENLRQEQYLLHEESIDWLLSISDQFKTFQEDFEFDRELSKIPYKLLKVPDTQE